MMGLVFAASMILSLPMPMVEDGSRSCLFMSGYHMICPMQAAEHLMLWKQSFLAVMTFGIVWIVFYVFGVKTEKVIASSPQFHQVRWRRLRDRNRRLIVYDFLRQSLAQGRLQPKIYDRN